jgi:hypothetical protein
MAVLRREAEAQSGRDHRHDMQSASERLARGLEQRAALWQCFVRSSDRLADRAVGWSGC